ncbi:MAG TPA: hypothetical protein VJP88_00300 [Caulobacteraceae bacterium]|nr:hypothetical protein [Caulobacteraceae bacterium]
MQLQTYRRAFLLGADNLRSQPFNGVHVNCSVAGVAVLVMSDKSLLPVQLNVGANWWPYNVIGYTATGSSGTFTVYGLE